MFSQRFRSTGRLVALALMLGLTSSLMLGCGSEDVPTTSVGAGADGGGDADGDGGSLQHLIEAGGEHYTGDLDTMRKRGIIRALVVYSRTDFFLDQGRARGIQHDFLIQFENQLNAGISKPEDKIQVRFLPVTFDQLIPALNGGLGDIAAAFLTLTDERKALVDFAASQRLLVDEIVVSHASAGELQSLDDLAGKQVYVLRNSSYAEHLRKLNAQFAERNLAPIQVTEGESHLLSEDILEMVNAGIVPMTVVDGYRAELWAKVMPNLRLHTELKLSEKKNVGWAYRKNSPKLKAELDRFIASKGKGSMVGNMLFGEYFSKTAWIRNPKNNSDKLEKYLPLFRKYAEKYDHPPLALAAQAYQESALDPNAKSHAGAVGLMQLLPSTAADKNVGIKDISSVEANIHAGAKYMAFLRDRYFSDAALKPIDRRALTLAAYNAGPAKMRKVRALAEEMGLNPNVWANNVEVATARLVGREPVTYVANILKYQTAYQLAERLRAQRDD